MTTIVNIIPSDFWEEAALYMVTLNLGSMLEGNKTGYNWNATNINKKAIVNDENTSAFAYFFLETSLGTLATAKKANNGKIKNTGYSLNLSVTPGRNMSVYKEVSAKLMIKNSIPFFNRNVNLAYKRPSVFNSKKIAPWVIKIDKVVKPTIIAYGLKNAKNIPPL